jgi:hypothetical protein
MDSFFWIIIIGLIISGLIFILYWAFIILSAFLLVKKFSSMDVKQKFNTLHTYYTEGQMVAFQRCYNSIESGAQSEIRSMFESQGISFEGLESMSGPHGPGGGLDD